MLKIKIYTIYTVVFIILIFSGCENRDVNPIFLSADLIAEGDWEGNYWPTSGWRYCKPEEVGMDSQKLKELNEEILLLLKLHININSVIIVKDGYIIAEQNYSEQYTADSLHSIYSCTKSLTSALIGIAIEKGFITDENERMTDLFQEYEIENLNAAKEAITLKHMLTMSAGLEWYELEYPDDDERNTFTEWRSSNNKAQFVLDRPMIAEPGDEYSYNSGISHLLSAIIKEKTGMRADSFAIEHLFAPLGISNYFWPSDSEGISYGGFGVRMRPHDMAKFAYLYLKGGVWDGDQLVPHEWVEVSQQKHIERKYIPGYYYGYHWWVNDENYYAAVGYGGQWIIIVPEHDLVVVFTNHLSEDDALQITTPERLLKTYILPAIL